MNYTPPTKINNLPNNTLLLDVRTSAEYQEKHLPGSVNIPLHQLDPEKIRTLTSNGSTPCLLICGSGGRAKQAAEKLLAAGITQISILEGGIKACEAASITLNRGKKTISIERQVRIIAGSLVLIGIILGATLHPAFYYLSAFVGFGLIFAGVTDWCGMAILLSAMPWNQAPKNCGCTSNQNSCTTT